jgi:hypothetical protein
MPHNLFNSLQEFKLKSGKTGKYYSLAALEKAGANKAVMEQITATGCDAEILPPAQTVRKIVADYAKWGRVVRDANIRAGLEGTALERELAVV